MTKSKINLPKQIIGFTLMELMITLSILSVIVVLAAPSFTGSVQRGRLTAQINQITGLIAYARSEAAKRPNTTITLCGSNDPTAATPVCNTSNWEAGWLIFSDANADKVLNVTNEDLNGNSILDAGEDINGNGILDSATDELLQLGTPLAGGNTLRTTGFTSSDSLQFNATGLPDSAGTFVLCDSKGVTKAKAVAVGIIGRTRLAVDEDTDNIVNDQSGANVTCP